MELEISVLSKPGGRTVNEDNFGVWSRSNRYFFVLSDGAGGHGGGDVASKLVVNQALGWFRQNPDCSIHNIKTALDVANSAVVNTQSTNAHLSNMRATVVVLVIDVEMQRAIWGYLGDTRLYCFRNNNIIVQTRDHSLVQNMVDTGYLKESDLRKSPLRNRLLTAMGERKNFSPFIEEHEFYLKENDVFLLCTDGCWEYMEEHEMQQALMECSSCDAWLKKIEDCVLSLSQEGHDNYSALAIRCKNPATESSSTS